MEIEDCDGQGRRFRTTQLKIVTLSSCDEFILMLSPPVLPDHGFHNYHVDSGRLHSYLDEKIPARYEIPEGLAEAVY